MSVRPAVWGPRHQRLRVARWVLAIWIGLSVPATGIAADIFNVEAAVPQTPAGDWLLKGADCVTQALSAQLQMQEAVERAVCANARAVEAWANIKLQAAALGISRSAFFPSLVVTAQASLVDASAQVDAYPALSSASRQRVDTRTIALNWVLYDFGRRAFDVRNSEHLLSAAQANHAAVLLEVFADVARSYYAAQGAEAGLAAAREVEGTAKSSYLAASDRADHGVAPVSDALQAQTASLEATLLREKADGDLRLAVGTLAVYIGVSPDSTVTLPLINDEISTTTPVKDVVSDLIQKAQAAHPRIVQARSQMSAATAKVDQLRAEYLPTVSLKASASHNNAPVTVTLGSPQLSASANDHRVALELNVPLFDGFGRDYRVRQAVNQVEVEQARVTSAQQQVAADVWASHFALQTASRSFEQGATLLTVAEKSYTAAKDRYLAGVGGIVELLNTQTALATARRRRLQAAADWRAAELQLAARLGTVGLPRHR